ncbi:MAG: hypothetical protein RR513_09400 [Muribaculaceae bacterium]
MRNKCCYIPEPPYKGADGETPFIGLNGNWWIGTKDTGVKADGEDGISPNIGVNGNWFVGAVDTGVKAVGQAATITVGTTNTLPAGSSATVVNSGTTAAAIFNFGIPQGQAGGSGTNIYSSFFGALLNDGDLPSQVISGARIPWKVNNNNETGLIKPSADNSYFQFTQLGRYLCIFSLRCAVKTAADNTVVNWGMYAQSIQKEMITSASSFVTPNMTDISGVGIIDVKSLAEQYNFINNSMVTINVQGATKAQTFYDNFYSLNGLNQVDGMSVVFLRLGNVPNLAMPIIEPTLRTTKK